MAIMFDFRAIPAVTGESSTANFISILAADSLQ